MIYNILLNENVKNILYHMKFQLYFQSPFYEVRMWLDEDVMFSPPLQHDEPNSLNQLFQQVIDKIFSLSTVIKRLNKDDVDYYVSII